MEANGQGLVDFWAYAAESDKMPSNTAGALRAACKEVLQAVEGETWRTTNLRQIDIEEFAERFARLRAGRFKPATVHVYQSRFKNAVRMYNEYLENPNGWQYRPKRRYRDRVQDSAGSLTATGITRSSGSANLSAPASLTATGITRSSGSADLSAYTVSGVTMLDHHYPLRPDLIVRLSLPTDLKKNEAQRLAAFIDSLIMEPTSASTDDRGATG